eukprot:9438712-Heterocapsa_arctica.AAC.1
MMSSVQGSYANANFWATAQSPCISPVVGLMHAASAVLIGKLIYNNVQSTSAHARKGVGDVEEVEAGSNLLFLHVPQ